MIIENISPKNCLDLHGQHEIWTRTRCDKSQLSRDGEYLFVAKENP